MSRKPKNNATNIPVRDCFQTPPYAVDILMPYVLDFYSAWEPAWGEGILARALYAAGLGVVGSDIKDGVDFFDDTNLPDDQDWQVQITNPPYSKKYKWLERSYLLGKPFALLMPSDTMFAKTAQTMFTEWGITILLPDRRINFKAPYKGWDGTAQYHSSWFLGNMGATRGIEIVQVKLPRYTKEELLERIDNEGI